MKYVLCILAGVLASFAVAHYLLRRSDKRADDEADRRAIETYEAWKHDPSGAVPLERFEAELEANNALHPVRPVRRVRDRRRRGHPG